VVNPGTAECVRGNAPISRGPTQPVTISWPLRFCCRGPGRGPGFALSPRPKEKSCSWKYPGSPGPCRLMHRRIPAGASGCKESTVHRLRAKEKKVNSFASCACARNHPGPTFKNIRAPSLKKKTEKKIPVRGPSEKNKKKPQR